MGLEETFNDSVCVTLRSKTKRIFHWAPLIALFIIFYVAACTNLCLFFVYHPFSCISYFLHFLFYLYEFYLVLNNYLSASFLGPGFVPYNWAPENPENKKFLQYCELCESYKPPRSHHCRKCDRCVLKMDHHCPWINTCCGHQNHGYFVYFLLFAALGCIHSAYILGITIYYALFIILYDIEVNTMISLGQGLAILFSLGLAVGVVISVGGLWIFQMYSIMKNETGIENWIRSKYEMRHKHPDERPFIYPYDLGGWWRNIASVLSWKGTCIGNGVEWPVRKGCGQYDLTIEQIRQKRDKEVHSILYEIKRSYNGSYFPLRSFGIRVIWGSPCSDENRMKVTEGQVVKVTRWRKHWFYGQIVQGANLESDLTNNIQSKFQKFNIRPRGWFPSSCAKPYKDPDTFNRHIMNSNSDNSVCNVANGKAPDTTKTCADVSTQNAENSTNNGSCATVTNRKKSQKISTKKS